MEPTYVSFLASLWPDEGSKEEQHLQTKTQLPTVGKPQNFKQNYQKLLTIAQLILTVGSSTAEAITTARYKAFDALMKNFGCQITALDVQTKVKKKSLAEEAVSVAALCKEKIAAAHAMFQKPTQGTLGQSFLQYCRHVGLDFEVSKEFADLVSLHFLQIVNDTKRVGNDEVPFTNIDPLEFMKNSLPCKAPGPLFSFKTWVHGIQARESEKSVCFIQKAAATLTQPFERAVLIQRMLSQVHTRRTVCSSSSAIAASPQMYSGEAVIRAMKGILVVKNKLFFNRERIPTAEKDVVFIRMPEARILHDDEIKLLKPSKPVVVLEGYRGKRPLVETISEVGILTLLNVNLAVLPQFTSSFSSEPLADAEAIEDLAIFAEKGELVKEFRADHMFCSSVEVERDG